MVATITGLGHAFITGGHMLSLATAGYRAAIPRYDRIIFQNSDDLDHFVDAGWVDAERALRIVGSGVDTDVFVPATSVARPRIRVLMMSRLLWQKGVAEFLIAARVIRATRRDIEFVLAGEFDRVHPDAVPPELIFSAHQEGVVTYEGFVESPEEMLPDVDLCVFPSYREGCPRVVLEASACGVPTVGANVPGTREVIVNGETGLLVPVKDSEALRQAIEYLADRKAERLQMGRTARRRALGEWSTKVILQRHLEVYEDVRKCGRG
jgi:glycosyltransferase involved in cell wall biosynthesis